jgi:uncharacterized protein (TIGR02996 family)
VLDTTHPAATAFAARFLANPDDRLGRLVFADWLDEQGGESNAAWADYIRTQAEMEQLRWNDPAWDELTERATDSGRRVKAKLSANFARLETLTCLPKLIPPSRCVVRAKHLSVDGATVHLMPESVAREHRLVTLTSTPWEIYCACPNPADRKLHEKLAFILNRNVTLFGVDSNDIERLINMRYVASQQDTFLDCSTWNARATPTAVAEAAVLTVFDEMIAAGVLTVSFQAIAHLMLVAYFTPSGWRQREPMSMEEFEAVFTGLGLRVAGGVLPAYPNRLEFWHTSGGQRYLAHGSWHSERSLPRLWLSFSPVREEQLPNPSTRPGDR